MAENKKEIKKETKKEPNEMLIAAAKLYASRNAEYGGIWKDHPVLMKTLFPNGIKLYTPKDFELFHYINIIAAKIARSAHTLAEKGSLHEDSFNDNIVYSAMALCGVNSDEDGQDSKISE